MEAMKARRQQELEQVPPSSFTVPHSCLSPPPPFPATASSVPTPRTWASSGCSG